MTRMTMQEALRLGIVLPDGTPRRPGIAPVRPKRVAAPPELAKPKRTKGGRRAVASAVDADAHVTRFFVPVDPRSKQRARTQISKAEIESAFVQAKGNVQAFRKLLAGIKHRSFTPAATKAFESTVAQFAAAAMRSKPPFDVPVHLVMVITFSGDDGTWPTDVSDPDLDNVEKAVFDALNGVAWSDDRLVVFRSSVKRCGDVAGVHVAIREANHDDVGTIVTGLDADGSVRVRAATAALSFA